MSDSVSSRTRSKAGPVEDVPPLPEGRFRRKNLRNLLENSDQATLPATNISQSSDADEISVVFSNGSDRASSSVFSSIEIINHGSSTVLSSIDANTTLQASSAILSSDDDEDSFVLMSHLPRK